MLKFTVTYDTKAFVKKAWLMEDCNLEQNRKQDFERMKLQS